MTTTVQLKRGTRARLDALASTGGLLEGEPLFITDENRFGVASSSKAYSASTLGGDLAVKMAQTSLVSAYKLRYNRGQGIGSSLDWFSSTDGIYVLKTGIYLCRATARVNGAGDALMGIAINGDRTSLENRLAGAWEHDHAGYANSFTESNYWGYLYAGEFITAGVPSSVQANVSYGTSSFVGSLRILRID